MQWQISKNSEIFVGLALKRESFGELWRERALARVAAGGGLGRPGLGGGLWPLREVLRL